MGAPALSFSRLDARFGCEAAAQKPIGLITRLHDVAMMSEPIQQGRSHLGVNKHRRPLRKRDVGSDHHTGLLVARRAERLRFRLGLSLKTVQPRGASRKPIRQNRKRSILRACFVQPYD